MAVANSTWETDALTPVMRRIAEGADHLDRHPAFPSEAFEALRDAGALGLTLADEDGGRGVSFARELELLRAVSGADGSVGRILDGHLNAVERLTMSRPHTLEPDERRDVAAGELLLGVWGADPRPDEGEPARLVNAGTTLTMAGVKTYCSGAGGLHRALVVAHDDQAQRRLAYVDLTEGVLIDRSWYHGEGLRASESHRVEFTGARVLAVLGGPDEITRQPWFARDAIRTSATWAGIADRVVDAALALLAERDHVSDLMALAVGRLQVAQGTIERWLAHAAHAADAGMALERLAVHERYAVSRACREILEQAVRACGSHPLAVGGPLSRGRRDLDLFLLQHRLDPLLARIGHATLSERA